MVVHRWLNCHQRKHGKASSAEVSRHWSSVSLWLASYAVISFWSVHWSMTTRKWLWPLRVFQHRCFKRRSTPCRNHSRSSNGHSNCIHFSCIHWFSHYSLRALDLSVASSPVDSNAPSVSKTLQQQYLVTEDLWYGPWFSSRFISADHSFSNI